MQDLMLAHLIVRLQAEEPAPTEDKMEDTPAAEELTKTEEEAKPTEETASASEAPEADQPMQEGEFD